MKWVYERDRTRITVTITSKQPNRWKWQKLKIPVRMIKFDKNYGQKATTTKEKSAE